MMVEKRACAQPRACYNAYAADSGEEGSRHSRDREI